MYHIWSIFWPPPLKIFTPHVDVAVGVKDVGETHVRTWVWLITYFTNLLTLGRKNREYSKTCRAVPTVIFIRKWGTCKGTGKWDTVMAPYTMGWVLLLNTQHIILKHQFLEYFDCGYFMYHQYGMCRLLIHDTSYWSWYTEGRSIWSCTQSVVWSQFAGNCKDNIHVFELHVDDISGGRRLGDSLCIIQPLVCEGLDTWLIECRL